MSVGEDDCRLAKILRNYKNILDIIIGLRYNYLQRCRVLLRIGSI